LTLPAGLLCSLYMYCVCSSWLLLVLLPCVLLRRVWLRISSVAGLPFLHSRYALRNQCTVQLYRPVQLPVFEYCCRYE
jgi:hypothetical protein